MPQQQTPRAWIWAGCRGPVAEGVSGQNVGYGGGTKAYTDVNDEYQGGEMGKGCPKGINGDVPRAVPYLQRNGCTGVSLAIGSGYRTLARTHICA